MKQLCLTFRLLPAMAIMFLSFSCSKSDLSKPAGQQSVNAQTTEESVSADPESIAGFYSITRFIRDGKSETSMFIGYRFQFRLNGNLLAHTNSGETVRGTWTLGQQGTMLQIDISGNEVLDKLVGSWKIYIVTSTNLALFNTEGEGNKIIFTRLGA